MATTRQVEANRLNALKSTGPKTDEGKARSRINATRHGMAGESSAVDPALAEAFARRRSAWAAEYRPEGDAAGWALDQVVAASFRVEACTRAFDAAVVDHVGRAGLAWEIDRRLDAEAVASRLARDPALVLRRLESTRHGAELLAGLWTRLGQALDTDGGWTEAQRSIALDLLGVPAAFRDGPTDLDAPDGIDPADHLRGLVRDRLEALDASLAESLEPLDDLIRSQAEAGHTAILAAPARLILRYERDAWRRYHSGIRDLRNPPTIADAPPAEPEPEPAPEPRPRPAPAPIPAPRREAIVSDLPFDQIPFTALQPRPSPRVEPRAATSYSYLDMAVGIAPAGG